MLSADLRLLFVIFNVYKELDRNVLGIGSYARLVHTYVNNSDFLDLCEQFLKIFTKI